MRLATLADAKWHLQMTDTTRDAEVTQFLELASALVFNYIGAQADPTWTDTTAPEIVQAATLKALVHNWHHRGDDSDDAALWAQLHLLLMRTRDPALA